MITRFAPSPTGPLHLGHAYSALLAYDMAQAAGGTFLLRIEDIDQSRARPQWEAQIYDDLAWLGITWETPVRRQSDQMQRYFNVVDQLYRDKHLYICTCNRRDIRTAMSAPQEGADGLIYPGTCRDKQIDAERRDAVLRFDLRTYPTHLLPIKFDGNIADLKREVGDFIIGRKDSGTSYHLSVVLDDADQGVTDVVRGQDLYEATKIHVALQKLLGLPTPRYHHHRLIRDDAGKRLAKRNDARSIATYRAGGATPNDIRQMVGLLPA